MRLSFIAAMLLASGPALAQSTDAHRHTGFHFGGQLGLGYASSSESNASTTYTLSGGAGTLSLFAGGAVAENVILSAHLFDVVVVNPKLSDGTNSLTADDSSLGLVALGPALTGYFMPSNVYLTGTLALTKLTFKHGNSSVDSEAGFGARLAIGKEWWVSDAWGLGFDIAAGFSSNKDSTTSTTDAPRLTTAFGTLSFSASFH